MLKADVVKEEELLGDVVVVVAIIFVIAGLVELRDNIFV